MKQIVLIISVIVLMFISGCEKWSTTQVKYDVSCYPSGFLVSYTENNGDIEEKVIEGYRWSETIIVDKRVKRISLTVNADALFVRRLNAKIYVDTKIEAEETSELGFITLFFKL